MLSVHVRPGAARSEVVGLHGAALAVRVAARPVVGAANRALIDTLAAALGVRPGALAIAAGEHGREKRVRVVGLTAAGARARLGPPRRPR